MRYFAAIGADFLGFSPDDVNEMEIVEMIKWVSGPRLVLDLRQTSVSISEDLIAQIDGLIIQHYSPGLYQGKVIFSESEAENIDQVYHIFTDVSAAKGLYSRGQKLILDTKNISFTQFQQVQPYLEGILISGGQELKPGLKDYDRPEEILSWLESA